MKFCSFQLVSARVLRCYWLAGGSCNPSDECRALSTKVMVNIITLEYYQTYLSPAFVKDCVVNFQKRLRERIPDTKNIKSSVRINYNIYIIYILYAGDYRVITATAEFN
jgi:hypothetical protein